MYKHTYIHTHIHIYIYTKLMVKSAGFGEINYYIYKIKTNFTKKELSENRKEFLTIKKYGGCCYWAYALRKT